MDSLEIKYTLGKGITFRKFQDNQEMEILSDSKMMGYMNQGSSFNLKGQNEEAFINALAYEFDGVEDVQIKAFMNEEDFLWLWNAMKKHDIQRQFMLFKVEPSETSEQDDSKLKALERKIEILKAQMQSKQEQEPLPPEATIPTYQSPIQKEQSQARTQILEICESMKLPENVPLSMGMKAQLNLLLTRNQIIRIADKARILTYNNTPFNIKKNVPYGEDNVKFYSKNICDIVQHLIAESFFLDASRNRTKLLKQKAQDFINILQKKFGKNIKPQVQIPVLVLPDISSDMEYIFIQNINKNDSSNLHKGFMSWDIYHFIERRVPYVMTFCEQDYIHAYNTMLDSIANAFIIEME